MAPNAPTELLTRADEQSEESEQFRQAVRDLLDAGGPGLALQPIIHLQTGEEVGVEVLSRFPGTRPVTDWFTTAHALQLGNDLELCVLEGVMQHLVRTAASSDFVAVNLSPSVLDDPRCLALIREYDCRRLVIELVDEVDDADLSALRGHVSDLKDEGVRVGVHVSDRIDTHMFSIVEPDIVKLGVGALAPQDDADGARASSTAAYLRHHGVFVVAVGVDSQDSVAALHGAGVDAAQGHFFGLPRSAQRT